MERKKKDSEKSLDYLYGYRDGLEDIWEDVLKMSTKGYSSHEMQIVVKSKAYSSKKKIDDEISRVEAAQGLGGGQSAFPEEMPSVSARERSSSVGIPPAGAEPEIQVVKDLKQGMSYLIKEPKPSWVFKIFERQIANGSPGLCVIRMSPLRVKEQYDLGMSKIIWLTKHEKVPEHLPPSAIGLATINAGNDELEEEYVDPSNLPILFARIIDFLDGHEGSVTLLEGVEYMISHNKFGSVMSFIQKLNERVVTSRANLLLSVNPQALEDIQLNQLEREMSETL